MRNEKRTMIIVALISIALLSYVRAFGRPVIHVDDFLSQCSGQVIERRATLRDNGDHKFAVGLRTAENAYLVMPVKPNYWDFLRIGDFVDLCDTSPEVSDERGPYE